MNEDKHEKIKGWETPALTDEQLKARFNGPSEDGLPMSGRGRPKQSERKEWNKTYG